MINKFVDVIYEYFNNNLDLEELDSIKLKYTLQVIMNDFSKLFVLFIIFSLVNKQIYLIYSIFALLSIRLFTGGLHFKTYNGCLAFSVFFFLSVLISSIYITLNFQLSVILFIFTFITVLLLAPITYKSRPEYSKVKKLRFKFIGLLSVLFHFVLFFIYSENIYAIISIWVLTFQALQLIIARGVLLYGKDDFKFQENT